MNTYKDDLDADFIEVLIQFKTIVSCMRKNKKNSIHASLKLLTASLVISTFPSLEIVLKLFTHMSCSNTFGERSFFVLKGVETYFRSSLANKKTSSLSLLCIESKIVKMID